MPESYTREELIEKRGEVPRLNISLFEITDRDDIHRAVFIENEAFDIILDRLFGRYQFTVFESTPEDTEIAIDPEILGRVLEKQLTGRQETGAYYTPRPFIAFLCREAIKGYLAARTWERADAITALVDRREGRAVEDAEGVLNALKSFTCVDPACGSGAYLLGMLHELMALGDCLYPVIGADSLPRYERKLEIIQRNLHGVDRDPFAVNAARLRLWLSLLAEGAVEEVIGRDPWRVVGAEEEVTEGSENEEAVTPSPDSHELTPNAFTVNHFYLPSLDFRILAGDSLACPDPSGYSGQRSGCDEIVRLFEEKKHLYGLPRFVGDKKLLLEEIRALRSEILSRTPGANDAFDWRIDFCGIFNPSNTGRLQTPDSGLRTSALSGFDAVLTNPPYIRAEAVGREYKEKTLKRIFPNIYKSAAEFVTYFYVRGVQLLRRAHGDRNSPGSAAGGMMGFVSSNRWFRSASGASLRQFLADHCAVLSITDFGDLPIFESASAYPMIFLAQKGGTTKGAVYTEVKSLNPPYPDVKALMRGTGRTLPANAISGSAWSLADSRSADRIRIMRSKGIPLGEYVKGKVYRGLVTSLNTAYVIDDARRAELIADDPRSDEIIQPLAVGHNIQRWCLDSRDQWLIVTRMGLDIDAYPAIAAHLNSWESRHITWQEKSEEGWEPRTIHYQAAFEEPKIVFQEVATFPHFAFDCEGTYINNEVLTIPTSDLFVLALLNSNHVWEFLQSICPNLPNGALTLQTSSILNVPVPPASEADREALAEIARMCLEKRGIGVEREEAEINRRVAALYGV